MDFIIATLATFCITYFLTQLEGPFGIFYKLRKVTWLGALQCFACTSIYISAIVALYVAHTPLEWLIHSFAIAGGAILAYEIIERI